MEKPPLRVIVLASGNGSNFQAIADQARAGRLCIEIVMVISDRQDAQVLARARSEGVKNCFLNPQDYASRLEYDCALRDRVQEMSPDLIVLAGFMRILTAEFVGHFENRIMNIHPSLLPKFKGMNTHARVLEAGERQHGATVHFVTAELDSGPIIVQKSVDVLPTDSVEDLTRKVHECEYEIYPLAIRWYSEGVLNVEDNKVRINR